MKKTLAIAAVALLPSMALAQSIVGSKHDLTSGGASSVGTGDTTQVCAFCHIPHGADPSTNAIWNRTNMVTADGWGGQTSVYGTALPGTLDASDGPTLRCLSCHDGTTGVGAVRRLDAVDNPTLSNTSTPVPAAFDIYDAGTGMQGNHPVGVPYPVDATSTYNGITTAVTNFADFVTDPDLSSNVKLFGTGSNKGIECSSCHNPHDAVPYFLLEPAANSAICTACHVK